MAKCTELFCTKKIYKRYCSVCMIVCFWPEQVAIKPYGQVIHQAHEHQHLFIRESVITVGLIGGTDGIKHPFCWRLKEEHQEVGILRASHGERSACLSVGSWGKKCEDSSRLIIGVRELDRWYRWRKQLLCKECHIYIVLIILDTYSGGKSEVLQMIF